MKKRILLLSVLFPLAVSAVEPISGVSGLSSWQKVGDGNPAPVLPVAPAVTSAPTSPSYYSASRDLPPLPFNPHPECDLYDLGGNIFMYDDSATVFAPMMMSSSIAPPPCETCGTNGAGGGNSFSGPPAYSYTAGDLWLKITATQSNSFALLVTNVVPGTQYLLTSKPNLTNDIRSQWQPLVLFVPSANSATFTGAFAGARNFFEVWNYDAYLGPVVSISSPANASVITGTAKVIARVADIFPDRSAQLYVDGELVSSVTNGPAEFTLDTRMFANGTHTVTVFADTVPLTDQVQFTSSASVQVGFSNFLSSIHNAAFFSYGAATLNFNVTGVADYTLKIYDSNDLLKRTFTGSVGGGNFQVSWDMRDSGGNSLPVGADYKFEMAAYPVGQNAVASGPTNVVNWTSYAEAGFSAGHAFLFYQGLYSTNSGYEQADRDMLNAIMQYNDDADLFGPDPAGRNAIDSLLRWRTNGQMAVILNTMKRSDVSHIFYTGHGAPDEIGSGSDTLISETIYTTDIRTALSNSFDTVKGIYRFKNPKRYVEMDGCSTSMGDLPFAFGVPRINTDMCGIKPRSYFGWNVLFNSSWKKFSRYQEHCLAQNAIWHNQFDEPVTIRDAMLAARSYYSNRIKLSEMGLWGSARLPWAQTVE